MQLQINFNQTSTQGLLATPGTSSTSSTSSTTAKTYTSTTDAAVQGGAYLGYLAMLENYLTGQTTSNATAQTVSNEANRVKAILTNLASSISSSTDPNIEKVHTDITTALSTLSTQGGSAMVSWYAGSSTSPVGDILTLLQSNIPPNTQFSPETQFALTMFLMSGNLQVNGGSSLVLQTTLSSGLESLLGDANESINPFDNGNWTSALLSTYALSNATTYAVDGTSANGNVAITGGAAKLISQAALLAAILPPSSTTTPNYNAFYTAFTGNNYKNWTLSSSSVLNGLAFWGSNILPTN